MRRFQVMAISPVRKYIIEIYLVKRFLSTIIKIIAIAKIELAST
jgi:hypothetical protein